MTSETTQLSDPCATLDEFLSKIKEISESPLFQNVEAFTDNFKQLTAKVKDQEKTMMASRNELIRTKQELEQSHERLLRAHREGTHQVMNEKTELQVRYDRLQAEVADEKAHVDDLNEKMKVLRQQVSDEKTKNQKLHSEIASLKQGSLKLQSELAATKGTLSTRDNEANNLKVKIKQQDKSLTELSEKQSGLNNKLKDREATLKQVHNLAPSLVKDDIPHLRQSMNRFWRASFEAVTRCFDTDITTPVLEDEPSWKAFKEAAGTPPELPLPPSNATPAKRIRTAVVMTVLADLLAEQIFTPSYLFWEDEEFRRDLFDLAMTEPDREKFLRRVLNSTSKDKQAMVMASRNKSVVEQVTGCVHSLTDEKVRETLGATLSQILVEATELWGSVQCMVSHFDTDVAFDRSMQGEWRSVGWTEQNNNLVEREVKHKDLPALDACLVLFPRVFIVADKVEQPVFPGMVLPWSETLAAKEEWDKIRQSKPVLGRSSTSRSARPRRLTANGSDSARRSFLG